MIAAADLSRRRADPSSLAFSCHTSSGFGGSSRVVMSRLNNPCAALLSIKSWIPHRKCAFRRRFQIASLAEAVIDVGDRSLKSINLAEICISF
jgi:hypothetical protein